MIGLMKMMIFNTNNMSALNNYLYKKASQLDNLNIPAQVNPNMIPGALTNMLLNGGAGVAADIAGNTHLGGYTTMDNLTSGVGGILGGKLGKYLAKKLDMGAFGEGILSTAASAIGGKELNKFRRHIGDNIT